jgi:HEAT repeat protein
MAQATADLVNALASPDFNARAKALAELIARGRESAPALRAALAHSGPDVRVQVAQALAEIADVESADAFATLLRESDGALRARGAQGLARIGDPRALDALVQTIDEFTDVLHSPYTLSLYGLIELGPRALAALVPLLEAPEPMTRMHALLALRSIAERMPGAGAGDALWRRLGSYDPQAPKAERDRAAALWLEWVRAADG